jgi:hypothetical protein
MAPSHFLYNRACYGIDKAENYLCRKLGISRRQENTINIGTTTNKGTGHVDTNGGHGACGRGSPLRPNLGRTRGEEVWYGGEAGQAR